MKKMLNRLNNFFEAVPGSLRKRRLKILTLFLVMTIFISFGITRIKFDMTLDSWFSDDDPVKVALNDFRNEFGSDDGIFIVYAPKDGDVFSEASLHAVEGIRQDLLAGIASSGENESSPLNHIVRIDNIVGANILRVENNFLISEDFIGAKIPKKPENLEKLKQMAMQQRDFPLMYFSRDFKYGGMVIQTDFGTIPLETDENTANFELGSVDEGDMSMEIDDSMTVQNRQFKATQMGDYVGLMNEIEKILHKPEYSNHFEYYPVGNSPMMKFFLEIMQMGGLYAGMLLTMVFILWLLFRSLASVVWPLMIVLLSTIWTLGVLGWLGATITNMITLTVMLILAIGVADTIHILSGYTYYRKKDMMHQEALDAAFRKSALPCLLTTITTMIGMLVLTLTPISHISVFGFSSAFGVGMAFFFTVFLLPIGLDFWSPVAKKEAPSRNVVSKTVNRIGKIIPDVNRLLNPLFLRSLAISEKHPMAVVGGFLGVLLLCVYGATQVKIDTNFIEATREGHPLRTITDLVDKHMMGAQNMEILVDTGNEDGLQDPRVLQAIEKLQHSLESKHSQLVIRTFSLANIVKDTYKALHNDREEMYLIPNDRRVLVQTLFMFNNANPEDRRRLVSDNYSKSHISINLHSTGSFEYTHFFKEVNKDIETIFSPFKKDYPMMKVTVTGGLALLMKLTDYTSKTQLKSFGMALVIISIVLIFLFGSFKIGVLAIFPNILPATLTFGLMGLFDIPLDADKIVIAPVIIGIAVDDTIHFITHYREEFFKIGDTHQALANTIKEVGQAITYTSLILGIGFSILANSAYLSLSKVGIFGSIAIFAALLCDLLLLPALILLFKPQFLAKKKGLAVPV